MAYVATGCGSGGGNQGPEVIAAGLHQVRQFHEYPLFWLGPSFGKLKLTGVSIDRVDALSADHTKLIRTHSHTVGFVYGTCNAGPGDEESCAPPLDVQNWPACGRNAALYHLSLPLKLHVRGAPAKRFGDRIEIWTGASDVVIFFAHPDDAAAALRGIGPLAHVLSGKPLPKPVPGAIAGHLRCRP